MSFAINSRPGCRRRKGEQFEGHVVPFLDRARRKTSHMIHGIDLIVGRPASGRDDPVFGLAMVEINGFGVKRKDIDGRRGKEQELFRLYLGGQSGSSEKVKVTRNVDP